MKKPVLSAAVTALAALALAFAFLLPSAAARTAGADSRPASSPAVSLADDARGMAGFRSPGDDDTGWGRRG
ncbi:hypothetical protein [Streptomyces sparsogenes]|uniref:Secreted protein n=1 Tax=Streptomyces sparsogenes DSM 40356 TaxID=1331668 RepID=A0A1R1SDK3_9ACTN|nr:hypothetical protein [Streptomyces sparsogenes]OMI36424.1 hypothetical protein SPAR_26351 [Streptomyces sparsogenes DSM 40356]